MHEDMNHVKLTSRGEPKPTEYIKSGARASLALGAIVAGIFGADHITKQNLLQDQQSIRTEQKVITSVNPELGKKIASSKVEYEVSKVDLFRQLADANKAASLFVNSKVFEKTNSELTKADQNLDAKPITLEDHDQNGISEVRVNLPLLREEQLAVLKNFVASYENAYTPEEVILRSKELNYSEQQKSSLLVMLQAVSPEYVTIFQKIFHADSADKLDVSTVRKFKMLNSELDSQEIDLRNQ